MDLKFHDHLSLNKHEKFCGVIAGNCVCTSVFCTQIGFKGPLHYFSTCIEITGNKLVLFYLKECQKLQEKIQRVKKL